jgi:exosome complex component RRP43
MSDCVFNTLDYMVMLDMVILNCSMPSHSLDNDDNDQDDDDDDVYDLHAPHILSLNLAPSSQPQNFHHIALSISTPTITLRTAPYPRTMAAAAAAPPPALTFPRPIFAAVSPHPFLQAHLAAAKSSKSALRANGRTTHEFRTPGINTGSLTHCNGSAVVRLGNTSVVCGVRAEILKEQDMPGTSSTTTTGDNDNDNDDSDDVEALRLLVPNVELSTGSTPQHIPGNAPSSTAQALITRLRSLLHSTRLVRASDLRITHTPATNPEDPDSPPETELKGYWVLYLDVFFISIDGNAFDAAWLSLLAALRSTRLPRAAWDDEYEGILCSDARADAAPLRLHGLPVPASFAVFEGRHDDDAGAGAAADAVLSDPDAFEEGVCRESVCVVVDCSAGSGARDALVRRVEKSGGGVVGREQMGALVKRAVDRWGVVKGALEAV